MIFIYYRLEFDAAWLETEMSKYYSEAAIGLSIEDLCSTVFDVLTSSKTDTELQNDVSIQAFKTVHTD